MRLVGRLIEGGWLKTERIIEAFEQIQRREFVPKAQRNLAEANRPLSIGHGQTISQPLVVAFMMELLDPRPGEKILDIGSGSGWTTALLAHLVGEEGRVIGLEIIPALVRFGKRNVSKYNFVKKGRVKIVRGNGKKGYDKEAPFDKILVSAESKKLFDPWKKQLKVGGRIVVPIGNSICLFEKKEKGKFTRKDHAGFAFVPLVG